MITQVANNKPSGYQSVQCDAGIPVSGRTSDTGSYQILKLNADGGLAGLPTYINTIADIGNNPVSIPLSIGTPPSNTFLGSGNACASQITEGVYRLNPTFLYEGGAGGGISIILYQVATPLDAYISLLPPFNAFNPNLGNLQYGLYGYWHNSTSQSLGNTVQISYNRSNTYEVYLTQGLYKFAIVTDGAVVINNTLGYFGWYEFLKIT
jgi:hypothetical protein